jgi:hypothetical protein
MWHSVTSHATVRRCPGPFGAVKQVSNLTCFIWKMACAFFGQQLRFRRQKARFLPAAHP